MKAAFYHSALRSLPRSLGIGQVLRVGGCIRRAPYKIRFKVHPVDTLEIRLAGLTARFRAASASEMAAIATFGGERRLVERVLRESQLGDVVFDVGAHLGLYSVLLSQAVGSKGQAILFEPEPRAYRRLLENLQLNEVTNATVFDCALGTEEREVVLSADPHLGSGTSSVMTGCQDTPGSLTRVRMVVGDQFIVERRLACPTIVKVDVEGMEYEVLSGMATTLGRRECRLLLCEVHFSTLARRGCPGKPRELEKLVRSLGFQQIEWPDRSHLLASKA